MDFPGRHISTVAFSMRFGMDWDTGIPEAAAVLQETAVGSRMQCLQKLAVVAAVLVMAGCVMQPQLRIYSQPEGAYITGLGTGETFGMAPAVIQLDKDELARHTSADGCYIFDGIAAQWASGATSSLQNIRLCGAEQLHRDIVMSRPAGYPGLQQDLQIELQLRETRARELQAAAAMQQAQAAQQAAENYQRALYYQRQQLHERQVHEEQLARQAREAQHGSEAHDNAALDHARHADSQDPPQVQTRPAAAAVKPADPPQPEEPRPPPP